MAVAASTKNIALCEWLYAAFPAEYDWDAALCAAAREGCREVCRWCIARGARDLDNALVSAAWKGHVHVCSTLMRRKQFGTDTWDAALRAAAWGGHREACDVCVTNGANDLVAAAESARTAGHEEVVTHLLRNAY
jgi:hypothetical protein